MWHIVALSHLETKKDYIRTTHSKLMSSSSICVQILFLTAHYIRATTCKDRTCLTPTDLGHFVHSYRLHRLILRLLGKVLDWGTKPPKIFYIRQSSGILFRWIYEAQRYTSSHTHNQPKTKHCSHWGAMSAPPPSASSHKQVGTDDVEALLPPSHHRTSRGQGPWWLSC
jgi:hypothetical protein